MTSTLRFVPRRADGPQRPDEQGSVILVMIFLLFISIVVMTMTTDAIAQINLSGNLTVRNDHLQAALAGDQAAIAEIRAAASAGQVQVADLPCTTVDGQTNTSGGSSYSATVQYYAVDAAGVSTPVGCDPGLGPTISAGQYLTSAVVTSCAPLGACPTDSKAATSPLWRRVVSTYTFETDNANVPGGLIYGDDQKDCLVATSDGGASDSYTLDVTTSCAPGNPLSTLEDFQYTQQWNLEIQIDGSDYCVQDPEDTAAPGVDPTLPLGSCTDTAVDQWGVNDDSGIQGVSASDSPAGQPNSWCLGDPLAGQGATVGGQAATEPAVLNSCTAAAGATSYDWLMSASVGSGGAQPAKGQLIGSSDQLVNYQEFGRCLDMTNQDLTYPYLIDYTCKQFPDVGDFPIWNQRWCFDQLSPQGSSPQIGILYTVYLQTNCASTTDRYCLKDASGTATQSAQNWVTLTACDSSDFSLSSTSLLWGAWDDTGGALHDYTWTDSSGYCLEANPNNPFDGAYSYSTIQVDTCNGSYLQKWNAPPSLNNSQISNTHEQTGNRGTTGP